MELKFKNNRIRIRRSLKRDIILPVFWLIVLVFWLITLVLLGLKLYSLIGIAWLWVFSPIWGLGLLLILGFSSLIIFLTVVKYTL